MNLTIKNFIKTKILFRIFYYGQFLGFDVLPKHFYSEIPCIHKLRKETEWRKPFSMIGVPGADIESQLEFVTRTVITALENAGNEEDIYAAACADNGEPGYGPPIEAQFLRAFIVAHRPSQIVQVGCGVSTAICLRASRQAGYEPEIVCIDPFPTSYLKKSAKKGLIDLIEKPIQDVDYSVIETLSDSDLFFIDSTHCLGPSGEVTRLILEFLPRVSAGIFVHFHDIHFPYDYTGDVINGALFYQHESALLHAFLSFNNRFEILESLSMLHHERIDELKVLFSNYEPRVSEYAVTIKPGHFPSSTYLRTVTS